LKRALATDQTEFGCDPKLLHWFVLNEDKPSFCFAGIWMSWYSVRKKKEGTVQADIFGILTTEANDRKPAVQDACLAGRRVRKRNGLISPRNRASITVQGFMGSASYASEFSCLRS
jgi:hypothetical protein